MRSDSSEGVPKWKPYQVASGTADGGALIGDLQTAVLQASYSEVERPTRVYTTQAGFEKFLTLLRASGALPDPVNANLGKEGLIAFAGVDIDWSRYLSSDAIWDTDGTPTAMCPFIGINWNSLRLNVTRAGGIGSDKIGFITQLGATQPHPVVTNMFKRIEWKRCWSVDNGRRSFFNITQMTGL